MSPLRQGFDAWIGNLQLGSVSVVYLFLASLINSMHNTPKSIPSYNASICTTYRMGCCQPNKVNQTVQFNIHYFTFMNSKLNSNEMK